MRAIRPPKLGTVFLFLVSAVIYAPLVCIVIFSFNTKSGVTWQGFTLDWYSKALSQGNLTKSLINSLQVAAAAALISMGLGATGAVFMADATYRVKSAVNMLVYAPLVLPEVVLAAALMMVFPAVGIPFGKLALILSHTAFCVPYIYILTTIRLRTIDKHLVEAARDLGASTIKAARTITLPLIMPAVVSGGLLAFALSLDDVALSQFLSSPTSQTFPVYVYSMVKLGVTPAINAMSTILFVVMFSAVIITMIVGNRNNKSN